MNRDQSMSSAWVGRLLRSSLLGGACVAALAPIPAAAQDNSGTMETIVVTGIRGSLQRSLDIKRESPGVVDAISAEDIGKFPDTNLAEAMMRIPGITVTRGRGTASGGTGGTSSNGEASEITVRGFGPTFNETLFDGRQVATGTGDRAFDFSAIASDFVGQIAILKTPDATLSAGAIGATVNIKFPKPFDHPGLVVSGSFSGQISPERGKWSPNGSFLLSDTFANDTVGILIAGSYADIETRGNHINVQGWIGHPVGDNADPNAPWHQNQFAATPAVGTPAWFIQDYGIYHEIQGVERKQARVVLQWRPNDAIEITLNDNYSRDNDHQAQYGYSVWFNSGSMQNIAIDKNGTVVNFQQGNTPTDFQGQFNPQILQYNDYGANIKWNMSEKASFTLDYDHADGWSNPGGVIGADVDVGYGPSQNHACNPATNGVTNTNPAGYPCPSPNYTGGLYGVTFGIALPGGHNLPYPTAYGPSGDTSQFINNGLIGSHVLPLTEGQNLDSLNQIKLEGQWDDSDALSLKAGVQYVAEHKNEKSYDDFENNNWQAYSGYGPASNNYYINDVNPADPYYGQPAGVALPQDFFTKSFSTKNFISGWNGASNLPANILQYDPWQTMNYLNGVGDPRTGVVPGYNGVGSGCCAPPPNEAGRPFTGVYQVAFNPGNYTSLQEKTYSFYFQGNLKTMMAGMPLRVNFGTRYDITQEHVEGLGRVPTAFTVDAADHTAYDVSYSGTTVVASEHAYQYLLPNMDFTLSVTDDFDLRLNLSRTLTRPPISNLKPTFSVTAQRTNNVATNGGNTDLMPFVSDNVDVGAQWYYASNSYLSADVYLKSVSNFIIGGSTQGVFKGVGPGGTDITYTNNTTINGPAANVYGLEIAWQHVFGDSGFGYQINGTIVGTNKPYDPLDLLVSNFAVTGLADSANMVVFYDKDGFQARLAANWQDTYLDHFGQTQGGGSFGTEPTFVNTNWNMDFTTSYDVTENITAYFEAQNLTDATYSTHGRFANQLLDVADFGRKFIVGVHYKM